LAHIFFREYLQSLDILANADQNLFVLFVLMGWLPCNDINEHFLWKVFSMMLANTYLVNLPCLGDPLLLKHPRRLFPALLLI